MQLQVVQNDVTRHNTGTETTFGFNMNATAFRVLNSSLYQDKPGSIVRELSCNAVDSHVMAGTPDRPFVLHIPSELEPYLSIKDFGIGLDDNGVRNIFCGYFNSTKGDNNNVVGAFGLGSKTPFSYTDQFTITAIKDGVRRIYSAFLNDKGEPAIAAMDEAPTDEANGVEVMVPVANEEDFPLFRTAIAEQLRFFAVKPKLTNGVVDFKTLDTIKVADGIELCKGQSSYNGLWVVQGGVGYPLNIQTLRPSLSEKNRDFIDFLQSMGAVLTFPIGQIETTASREGLSYSKFTIANIDNMMNAARDVVGTNMETEVAAMATEWERATFLNANGKYSRILSDKDNAVFAKLVPSMEACNHSNRWSSWGLHLDQNDAVIQRWSREYMRRKYRVSMKSGDCGHIEAGKWQNRAIIIRDTDDKPTIRLTHYLETNTGEVYCIVATDTIKRTEITANMDKLGIPYTLLSTVAAPPRAARVATNSGYVKPTCYLRDKGDNTRYVKDWQRVVTKIAEIEDGGYYIIIPEYSRFEAKSIPHNLEFIYRMADADALDKSIFAIRERDLKRVIGNPEWTPLEERAQEMLDEAMSHSSLARSLAAKLVYETKERDNFTMVLKEVTDSLAGQDLDIPESFSNVYRFNLLLERLAAPARAADEWTVAILNQNVSEAIEKTAERLRTLRTNVGNKVRKEFPLLAHVPVNREYDYNTGDYNRSIDPDMVAHTAKYVSLVGNN